MVNLSKRMHKLMPLWKVKSGAGAAVLPPKPPAPQLTHLKLNLPNPCNAYDDGARQFWKAFLPGLRYHNLTLPIVVEQTLKPGPSFVPTMTLHFESENRDTLAKLEAKPPVSDAQALETARQQFYAREEQERVSSIEKGIEKASKEKVTWVEVLRKEQEAAGIPEGSGTQVGEVQTKPQPAADPSAPSTTSPPATIYSRTVTLGLRGRRSIDIWSYFKHLTKARQFYRSPEDRTSKRRFTRFVKRAEQDRQRVKAGIEAMKKEKEDLKRAREAADQLASEA